MTMHVFIVMLFLSEDGDFAEYKIHAQSSMMAVQEALKTYLRKANYPILEIVFK